MDEKLFIKLRDCFTAGYTLPQYCIDNGIKKPLFVIERNAKCFLLEVHAQFHYDKRALSEQFCFIDGGNESETLRHGHLMLSNSITVKHISQKLISYFDAIIFLTPKKYELQANRIISFSELEKFFIQRTYIEIPLLNFLQRNPKVNLILTNFPQDINRYKGGTEFEKKLLDAGELLRTIRENNDKHIDTPFDKLGYTNADVLNILGYDRADTNLDGTTSLVDDVHPLVNVRNGRRNTAYQFEHYTNKIFFVGPCHFFGRNAPYDKTIESYLQKMLNENNLPYRVENEGQAFIGRLQDMYYNLNALNPMPGDIIFFWTYHMRSNNDVIPFYDVSNAFDHPHDFREIFCTKGHVNELGYKIVAEKFFAFLMENNFFREACINYPTSPPAYHRYGIPSWCEQGGVKNFNNAELEQYKQSLQAKKIPIGAIVMNCNPFTLGHQYLVEYAASKVVKLYIFVVEEDRSEFPFADRFELVKQGVKDIPNVEVIPSGKFIISQTTFSGYFNKASLQDVTVDSSEDVEIFGQEIAPTLGITVRFAGEEPKDNVTRQYNETMKRILPRYGIEFHEIPRKTLGEEVISASYVREALKRNDFDKIRQLVPESTLKYLRERHSNTK